MATKYTILETAHTEESEPFSSKAKAVEAADAAAEQYPGTTFSVATGKGTIVHKALAESDDVVDEPPADDVPDAQVDQEGADFEATLAEVISEDSDPDTGEDDTPDDEDGGAGQDDEDADSDGDTVLDKDDQAAMRKLAGRALRSSKADAAGGTTFLSGAKVVKEMAEASAAAQEAEQAPVSMVSAPVGATLELCAANTNAKRMHYRVIGEVRTACGSANTSRRANAHQIETAGLCPACGKLAVGKVVDTRPAGAGRATGSRRAPKTLVVDAGEIRDIVGHLKRGESYEMELTDGTRVMVVAGDPATGEASAELGDMTSINVVAS